MKKLSKTAQRHLLHINFKGKNCVFSSLYPHCLAWSRCSNIWEVTECLNQQIMKSGDKGWRRPCGNAAESSLFLWNNFSMCILRGMYLYWGKRTHTLPSHNKPGFVFQGNGVMTLHKAKFTKIQALQYREGILSKCCRWSSRRGGQATCQWCVEEETRSGPWEVVQQPHLFGRCQRAQQSSGHTIKLSSFRHPDTFSVFTPQYLLLIDSYL